MPFQAVPDTAEALVVFQHSSGVFWVNTYYFEKEGGYTQAQINTLATTVDGWGGIQARAQIASDCTYNHTEIRGLANENDLFAEANAGTAIGALAGQALPINIAFAVKRLSGLTGRSARGRVFWGGQIEAEVTGNSLLVARANAIVAAQENLNTSVGIIGWTPVIVSRVHNLVPRPVGVTFPITTWAYTDLQVDTQRGRLPV